jgi:hypothetical protein
MPPYYRGRCGCNPPDNFVDHRELIERKIRESLPKESNPTIEVLYGPNNEAEVTISGESDFGERRIREIFATFWRDEDIRVTLSELRVLYEPRERSSFGDRPVAV